METFAYYFNWKCNVENYQKIYNTILSIDLFQSWFLFTILLKKNNNLSRN